MLEDILRVRPMEAGDGNIVAAMIKSLYNELGAAEEYMTDVKIAATFEQSRLQPLSLEIEVFELNNTVVGYALLFRFWYNEYGGMVLNVDELFVQPAYRNHGIASHYLSTLAARKDGHVALSLEVLPENKGAYHLYKRLGFQGKETITLHKIL